MRTDTPRRRWPVALLAVLAAVSTGGLVLLVAAGGPGVNHFRTAEGRAAYEEAYAAAMAGLPEPTATHDVATTFGTVRAYAWVDEEHPDATPVVLLPGRSAAVPMWADNLPDFARHRTVYAFDTLGDTGLSVQTLPLADVGDSARWVDEAMQALGIERAHLLGHSQGGGLAAAVAVRHPERLASLTLLEPVLTLGVLPMSTILYSIPASLPFVPEAWREAALNRIGGVEPEEVDPDDPLARLITEGSRHFASSSLPNPVPLTDDELRGLDMPVYVGLASDGSLSGGDAAERATLIPDARVKVWPDTTHSLPMQAADALGADLKQFWTTNDPSPR
ncbi:alpha/beta fold hydrolase [Promicromonospora thailandica]|uniref:Pimeloyl-ACP methyl ester carboxylesterase n=1 Tax=Promicromonospora thailandica TaxID=765201 RepID=A0A9X2G5I0_9MICO|nr:alpha/beta fold hydrolase [Promicromonospora thailandica]MCP2262901.1 Pimeloyl-ACP methyl ester carboxylesterase [Promicromonospora thailandica]